MRSAGLLAFPLVGIALLAALTGCGSTPPASEPGETQPPAPADDNTDLKLGWVIVAKTPPSYDALDPDGYPVIWKTCDGARLVYANGNFDRFWFVEDAPECAA